MLKLFNLRSKSLTLFDDIISLLTRLNKGVDSSEFGKFFLQPINSLLKFWCLLIKE